MSPNTSWEKSHPVKQPSRVSIRDIQKLVEKLFPTIALAYKHKHPTHLEIPMVMPQFLIKSYSLFYLFMRKLANERVSAVERVGEATDE